jgi:hypothetical protein
MRSSVGLVVEVGAARRLGLMAKSTPAGTARGFRRSELARAIECVPWLSLKPIPKPFGMIANDRKLKGRNLPISTPTPGQFKKDRKR